MLETFRVIISHLQIPFKRILVCESSYFLFGWTVLLSFGVLYILDSCLFPGLPCVPAPPPHACQSSCHLLHRAFSRSNVFKIDEILSFLKNKYSKLFIIFIFKLYTCVCVYVYAHVGARRVHKRVSGP